MRINYNVSAMLSNNALSTNDDLLSKSLERLSSGSVSYTHLTLPTKLEV